MALDPDTLEITNVVNNHDHADEFRVAGHGFVMPESGLLVVTANSQTAGRFDRISFRAPQTFKEVHSCPTYGFNVHEIRLTPDRKNFICGHYGSHLGVGPYSGLDTYGPSPLSKSKAGMILYPGAVTMVDVTSGSRTKLFSDVRNGQEGHTVADDLGNAYLPQLPARIDSPPDLLRRKRYQEGPGTPLLAGEYKGFFQGLGIALTFDPKFREVIVPDRPVPKLYITDVATQEMRTIDYAAALAQAGLSWVKFEGPPHGVHGMEFHPDGKHYILSTSWGFLAFERGTHAINPRLSFPTRLLAHSHMHVLNRT